MSVPFDVQQNVIIVALHLWGPAGDFAAEFVLDTGASQTVVITAVLANIGCDLTKPVGQTRVTTASGAEIVPRLLLNRFEALGQTRAIFPVLGLALPADTDIHGLLGLDFIRGKDLCVSYRKGTIDLT